MKITMRMMRKTTVSSRSSIDYGPCRMCGNSYEWHQAHFARHPYTSPNSTNELRDTSRPDRRAQSKSDAGIVHTTTPFDPVLRLVLIEKGIIGPEDLKNAEEKLGVVMRLVDDKLGESHGEQSPRVVEDPG